MILNSFVFYILFCSSVLIYGIGFNRESVMCDNPRHVLFSAVKSYSCVILSFIICYGLNKALLIPLGLAEVYPMIAVLVYATISVFLEILIQITTKRTSSEFAVSFLTLILALNEGLNLLDGILICAGALTSFYILIPVLYAAERRMKSSSTSSKFKRKSLIFLCMVIIMTALYSINISWLNEGVIK